MAVDGNKKIFAYSWSNSEYKWTCLGEVTGSKEDKKMYKGEYTSCYKRVDIKYARRNAFALRDTLYEDTFARLENFINLICIYYHCRPNPYLKSVIYVFPFLFICWIFSLFFNFKLNNSFLC